LFILCFGPINHRKNSFCLPPDTRERARDRRKKERARKRVRERHMEVLVKELCNIYSQNHAERHKIQISDQ
jgi:hypothetical protein